MSSAGEETNIQKKKQRVNALHAAVKVFILSSFVVNSLRRVEETLEGGVFHFKQ